MSFPEFKRRCSFVGILFMFSSFLRNLCTLLVNWPPVMFPFSFTDFSHLQPILDPEDVPQKMQDIEEELPAMYPKTSQTLPAPHPAPQTLASPASFTSRPGLDRFEVPGPSCLLSSARVPG